MVLFLIVGFFSITLEDTLTGFGAGLLTTVVGFAVITAFSAASLI